MLTKDRIERRRAKRTRKVVLNAMGRFVFFPWMVCFCLEMPAVVAVVRALHPDLDTNGWPFFLRAFPIWIVLMWLTVFVLLAVYVRLVVRRKGAQRAVRYLFPELLSRTENRLERIFFWALGIRRLIREGCRDTGLSYERDHHIG